MKSIWEKFRRLPMFMQLIIGFIAVSLLFAPFTGDEPQTPTQDVQQSQEEVDRNVEEPVEEVPEPEPVPEPASPKETLASTVEDVLGGTTNYDKPRLKEEQYDKTPKGWTVFVTFRADDNLTTGFRKTGIENDMRDTYKALYSGTDVPIKEVILDAEFPLVDDFGNESDGSVYVTYLKKNIAQKVNWSEADYLDWTQIWTTTVLHPEFRG